MAQNQDVDPSPLARAAAPLDKMGLRVQLSAMALQVLNIETSGPGLYEFTDQVAGFLRPQKTQEGLLTVFVRHTSCSLLIQENADPDVRRDLDTFFQYLVPPSNDAAMAWVTHRLEGPDDMPAHIKAALTQTSIGIPVSGGRMMLGTWQGLYLFEHREYPHRREIVLHLA